MKPLKNNVSISLDPEVIEKTRLLAEEHDRSFSSYINQVLKGHIVEEEKKHPRDGTKADG